MSGHDTAHLDGLRVAHVYTDDGKVELAVELWAGGRRAPELFEPVTLFQADDTPAGRAAVDRAALVLKALCGFVNAGGDPGLCEYVEAGVSRVGSLTGLVEVFAEACPTFRPPLDLVSVLPPAEGNVLTWARPDGTFLRVVEGEDGFTEVLTAAQLDQADADLLSEDP